MSLKIGMDVGSTTLKLFILDEQNHVVYQSYERHRSRVREMAFAKLEECKPLLEGKKLHFAMSGSAGMGIAKDGDFPFVQEVFASAGAVKRYYPKSDIVIELGGEDAKIIFLKGALEERMNSTCAGGTGAFIDQMASLLHLELAEMDALSLQYEKLYPIASRCGVFAKSDIQPLINQGVKKSDLCASIFQAVVDQTIAGLAQGRSIEGNVLFLGGPLSFLKGLRQRFMETLKLKEEQGVFPKLAPYFVALGAALYGEQMPPMSYETLHARMETVLHKRMRYQGLAPLFENDAQYLEFKQRHKSADVPRSDIHTYRGKSYLGIDCGSTTTKLVLIDEASRILYESYANNQGNPVDVILQELTHIYALCEDRIQIASSAVTGYGEKLMKAAFHLDIGMVETMAHYRAARHFNPNVDFIIDIGGQDMKCFRIKDHSIDDIILNEACSSGCGSFVETFAKSMGYSVEEFSQMGLAGNHPVDLGTRCTVFMNSSVKQAQKNGAPMEDISAGLSISVVKNALYKVIRAKRPEDIGEQIVVQGGTFLNDTVLRAFELELGRNVTRPMIGHLMGAFGAALCAKEKATGKSSMLNLEQLQHFTHRTMATNCALCTNHCSLTINQFADGTRHIAGNRCERPVIGKASAQELPNLYIYQYEALRRCISDQGNKGTIGIPLVLNLYDTLPFWSAFFQALDYRVVLSDPSSRKLYAKGQHTIPSDTACYPAKLVHGHILSLMEKKVDFIFYPCMSYHFDEHMADNHFNCPIVAYYPEVIAANTDVDINTFLYPYLYLQDPKNFVKRIREVLQPYGICEDKAAIREAAKTAYQAYHAYHSDLLAQGKQAIRFAQKHDKAIIVLAGRPYHIDPQINHGIHQLLTNLDFVVISENALPRMAYEKRNVLNQWTFHSRMYNAARYVATHANIQLIQLVSFGCGIDAITGDEVKEILRDAGKLYTQIKIDEVDNLGAVNIRVRSLKAAMEER